MRSETGGLRATCGAGYVFADKGFTGHQAEGSLYYIKGLFYPSTALRAGSPLGIICVRFRAKAV